MDKRILVIEDDPGSLRLVTYTLEREGFQVIEASDGMEGLTKAQDEHPDLIILDVMLPGLDGYEVCYQLRQKLEPSVMPILMLSAKARQDDMDTGLRIGADAYLSKPVSPSILVAKVTELLATTEQKDINLEDHKSDIVENIGINSE